MHEVIWAAPIHLKEINQRAKGTLSEHLGIIFTEIGPNSLSATMPVDHRTLQPMGILHGGASCALAETVGSTAANYCIDQEKKGCVGVEININHLKQVAQGIVTAVARPVHLGKGTQVWEIQISNEKKQLVAISRLTVYVIEKRPEGSRGRY